MTTFPRQTFHQRGLRLSYLDSAPNDASRPVIMLLHGFPDTATMWRPQIEALHAAGYRVLAPDTVGCGASEMAPRLRDCNCEWIAGDQVALLEHLGIARAHVAGHDWGAVVAWLMAGHFPDRVLSLTAMSVGHPTAYARAGFAQKRLGWYTLFFQLGGLAESRLLGEGRLSLRNVFRSHPDMDAVMQRLRAPGRMTAALRIYRAAIGPVLTRRQPDVCAPTLGLWSDQDRFLTEDQMQASERYCRAGFRYQRLAGHHWIPLQQPERVNQLLLAHLGASAVA